MKGNIVEEKGGGGGGKGEEKRGGDKERGWKRGKGKGGEKNILKHSFSFSKKFGGIVLTLLPERMLATWPVSGKKKYIYISIFVCFLKKKVVNEGSPQKKDFTINEWECR